MGVRPGMCVNAGVSGLMFAAIGLIVLLVMVFGGFAFTGGDLHPIMEAVPHEMIIIGGAAVGATASPLTAHPPAAPIASRSTTRDRADTTQPPCRTGGPANTAPGPHRTPSTFGPPTSLTSPLGTPD